MVIRIGFFPPSVVFMRQCSFQNVQLRFCLVHNINSTYTQNGRGKWSDSGIFLEDQIGDNSIPVGIACVVHHVTGEPWVVKNVFAGKPQLRVGLQHVDNEVPYTVSDIVPVRCREVKESVQDSIEQLLLLIVR